MSLSSQASGYMSSSSSSLQTSASSSSLTEESSQAPSSLGHTRGHGPLASGSWDDDDDDDAAVVSSDDPAAGTGEWRSGVTLRQGWEFLEAEGAGKAVIDLSAGANRLSLAETVKTVTPSVHRSNRSSTDRLSSIDQPAPSPAPTSSSSGSAVCGRTSRAPSVGASTSMPAHQEEADRHAAASPALALKPALLLSTPVAAAKGGRPSSNASTHALHRHSPTSTERSASPSLCASIGAWASNVPVSPGPATAALGHQHHYHSGSSKDGSKRAHHRSVEPPAKSPASRRSSVDEHGHRRAKSTAPVLTTTTPAGSGAATPVRPHKPRWLQASPSFSSPNLSAQTPDSPKRSASRREDPLLEVGASAASTSKGRRVPPSPSASMASLAAVSEGPLPLQPAPLLPPRPAAAVQKQSVEAEFTPSSSQSQKASASATPHAPASGSSGRGFTASNGLKGRLAAFGGMVGGAANHLYQEGLTGAQSSGNLAGIATGTGAPPSSASSSTAATRDHNPLSYSAYAPSQAAPRSSAPSQAPPPSSAYHKPSRGFQHAILSAPSSGVKMFNTAWKGKSSSSSGGGGGSSAPTAPRLETIDGSSAIPIMFNPAGSVAPGAEGRVFGRDVVSVAQQWGVREGVAKKRSGSVDEVSIEGSSVDQVSRENLPALVVRCVEYLEIWGPREEGIFRISGRSTHIVKLRAQLDTGADIDLKLSDAGDLDPHAVASVFKAYLRELPSSILTAALQPSFDAVMERFTGSSARGGEFVGLPHLKTTQEASSQSAAERQAQLKREIKELLGRLPVTCWALLKVVVGLLQHTDRHSKENKMGIPNLLLVLCPSICLSPPFLRLLIEHSAELFESLPQPEPAPASAPSPPLPPRPTATPTRAAPPSIVTDSEAPELDMPKTFPSPLPDFSVTEASPRPSGGGGSGGGWGTRPASPGLSPHTASPELVALPLSPSGSPKRKKTSLPTSSAAAKPEAGDVAASVALDSAAGSGGGALLEQPPMLRQRKRSIIDLANAAFASSSDKGGAGAGRSNPTSSSSPAAEQAVEDVLPPAGIVAAKKHMFSTPIADRFKGSSSVLPSFRSHSSKAPKPSKTAPDAGKKPTLWGRSGGGSGTSNDRDAKNVGTTSAP